MTALTDATFYAPLKTTLVPTNGSGNPTATRTSTKTVEDNEGIVKTLKSGAVALAGARVVQNICRSTEGIAASAQWTNSVNGVKTIANHPDATPGAVTYSCNTNATNYMAHQTSYTTGATAGETLALRFLYKPGISDGWCAVHIYNGANLAKFLINTSTHLTGITAAAGTGFTPITHTIAESTDYPGWYEADFVATVPASTLIIMLVRFVDSNSSTDAFTAVSGREITIDYPQFENVTGQAIQTAGEYVSVGVLPNPYHGLGTDGVQYFDTDSSAVAIPDATMLGAQLDYASKTNSMLYCRDLTNAAWVKTNCTAAKTQTGVDGLANSCSLLTFTADNGTCFQTITTASTPACTGWKVKRSVGTGSIYITRDNGSSYTDITSLINSGTFTLTGIENTSVLNPVVGFKGATSGDAIIVDSGRNHSGTELCEDIFTTTAAVTRAAESLTYQTSGNFSDTAGTILATVKRNNWANGNGSVVGKASFGLLTSASNSGVQAADGTNTVSGAAGTPTGQIRIGARWSGSSLQAFSVNPTLVYTNGTAGSYDGSFNLATIAVMPGTQGYIRDLAIFNSSLDDAAIIDAWDLAIIYALTCDAGSYSYTGIDATFLLARNLACDTGSYAYNGLDITLNLARNLACDPGAYSYTGISAALTIITPARLITVNYNTPGIIVDYNTYDIEVDT